MAGTHRLAVKIEETVLNNGVWDKVTVKIPNSSYILTEVKHENNKLSVLFEYGNESYQPMNFAFMLSAFGVNPNDVAEDDEFLVVGCDAEASRSDKAGATDVFPDNWFDSNDYEENFVSSNQTKAYKKKKFECPPECPF